MDASVNRIASSKDERALLISIYIKGENREKADYSLDELKLLVETAGAVIVDSITIKRDAHRSRLYLRYRLYRYCKKDNRRERLKLIVFDLINIRPAQIRNLEEKLKLPRNRKK